MSKYKCSKCGKVEEIQHVNPIIEPYICLECILKDLKERKKINEIQNNF